MEKQARNEQDRVKRLTTPDVFARTGYPPINSPSRDLRAAEVRGPNSVPTASAALGSQ